jgi:hypothetical protein
MKLSKTQSSYYHLAGLVAMSLVCSCTSIQNMQSSLDKTAKMEEYYRNQDADLWTAGTAINGTVSSKEFLEIQSTFSPQVKDALAKYGQPDFIRLEKEAPDAVNSGFGNLISSAPLFNMALLYHSTTNLIVMINQNNGKMSVRDYEEEEARILELIETKLLVLCTQEGMKLYEEKEALLAKFTDYAGKKLRNNPSREYTIWFDDPEGIMQKSAGRKLGTKQGFGGPVEMNDLYFQSAAKSFKTKRLAIAKQAGENAQKDERERRERLPSDTELRKLLIGYWEYATEEKMSQYSVEFMYTVSESSVIEYKSDQTFSVRGKIQADHRAKKVAYEGTWDVKDGKIKRIIQTVQLAGRIDLGLATLTCIEKGTESEDVISSTTTTRVELLKEKNRTSNKVLSRLKTAPADTSKPDIQKFNVLKDKAEKLKKKTFVFKAFYLGMPIEDAAALAAYYFGDISKSACYLSIEKTAQGKWFSDDDSGLRVEANNEGQVIAIYLPREAVDKLFDAKDVEVKSFIKTFQGAYDLPSFRYDCPPLECFSNNSIMGKTDGIQPIAFNFGVQEKWTATSDQGYSITVYGDVTIFDKRKQLELSMGNSFETIPRGSILVRKINTAAMD